MGAPAGGRGVEMVTLPLDLDDLLASGGEQGGEMRGRRTGVGHVHLKVADVPRAAGFYRDALGFEEQALLPSAAFVSAGGYHHHLGLNSWQSAGGAPAPENAPGLRLVEFELAGEPSSRRSPRRPPRPTLRSSESRRQSRFETPTGMLLRFSSREDDGGQG